MKCRCTSTTAKRSDASHQVAEVLEAARRPTPARRSRSERPVGHRVLLQKLRDRFTIPVELSDTDVESVTRKVLLDKKPISSRQSRPDSRRALRRDRPPPPGHSHRSAPGRPPNAGGRLSDPSGPPAALGAGAARPRPERHQEPPAQPAELVQEALRQVAERLLGTVIAADFLFDNLRPDLLQGVLLSELHNRLLDLEREGEEERLLARICGLVFLLRRLPREGGLDLGIRATAEVLADLLVEDLAADGARLRAEMPRLLRRLVDGKRLLVEIDREYSSRRERAPNGTGSSVSGRPISRTRLKRSNGSGPIGSPRRPKRSPGRSGSSRA